MKFCPRSQHFFLQISATKFCCELRKKGGVDARAQQEELFLREGGIPLDVSPCQTTSWLLQGWNCFFLPW
jgi:hypothetical protein